MTPEAKAQEVVASWPTNNFMDQSARPTIQKQIAIAIKEMMLLENMECAKALQNLEGFGPYSRQVAIETIRSRHDVEWEV